MTPKEFIDGARTWLGTPFHHQQSVKGVGADCVGFPKGVLRDLGEDVSEVPTDYSEHAQPKILLEYLYRSTLVHQDKVMAPGHIVLVCPKNVPHHFGILTYNGWWVHADRKMGVVETPLGDWEHKVHSIWVPNRLRV